MASDERQQATVSVPSPPSGTAAFSWVAPGVLWVLAARLAVIGLLPIGVRAVIGDPVALLTDLAAAFFSAFAAAYLVQQTSA